MRRERVPTYSHTLVTLALQWRPEGWGWRMSVNHRRQGGWCSLGWWGGGGVEMKTQRKRGRRDCKYPFNRGNNRTWVLTGTNQSRTGRRPSRICWMDRFYSWHGRMPYLSYMGIKCGPDLRLPRNRFMDYLVTNECIHTHACKAPRSPEGPLEENSKPYPASCCNYVGQADLCSSAVII